VFDFIFVYVATHTLVENDIAVAHIRDIIVKLIIGVVGIKGRFSEGNGRFGVY
jgi:hypothetical protein